MASKSLAIHALCLALPAFIATCTAHAEPKPNLWSQRARVARATVTLPELGCAGSIAGTRSQVLTSAHCVPDDASEVDVTVRRGHTERAWVAYIDRDSDLALLKLDEDVPVEPLTISSEIPELGTRLLFVGRIDRPSRTQVVRVERLGRCPSLPEVDDALFTTLVAYPGDSGAPLVDQSARVVGLVHGGARCHIAAPTAPLGALGPDAIDASASASGRAPTPTAPSTPPPAPTTPDSFVWERTPDGFRLRFHFSWGFKTP